MYHSRFITATERATAMCTIETVTVAGSPENYKYCYSNGTQPRLTDSELGPEKSINYSLYYEWNRETTQLLFIFSTRVNLTTITLHYYSGSQNNGLPTLMLFAVPDNFYVWNNATFGNHTSVRVTAEPPADSGSRGRRNVSVNVNFNTKKVLMVKERSGFNFAVSEVEFCTRCSGKMIRIILHGVLILVSIISDSSSDDDIKCLKPNTASSVTVIPTNSIYATTTFENFISIAASTFLFIDTTPSIAISEGVEPSQKGIQ